MSSILPASLIYMSLQRMILSEEEDSPDVKPRKRLSDPSSIFSIVLDDDDDDFTRENSWLWEFLFMSSLYILVHSTQCLIQGRVQSLHQKNQRKGRRRKKTWNPNPSQSVIFHFRLLGSSYRHVIPCYLPC